MVTEFFSNKQKYVVKKILEKNNKKNLQRFSRHHIFVVGNILALYLSSSISSVVIYTQRLKTSH